MMEYYSAKKEMIKQWNDMEETLMHMTKWKNSI